jgi:hypothetical protein
LSVANVIGSGFIESVALLLGPFGIAGENEGEVNAPETTLVFGRHETETGFPVIFAELGQLSVLAQGVGLSQLGRS